jgi:hypothetical protein
MKAYLILAAILASFPAWAQGYPNRNDCNTITKELAMRPPANGDAGRASYDYQSWVGSCTGDPWKGMVSTGDLDALKTLTCQHGGFVDAVNMRLYCH